MADEMRQLVLDLLLAVAPVITGWLGFLLHRLIKGVKEEFVTRKYWFYLELLDQTVAVTVKSLMPKVARLKELNQDRKLTEEQVRLIQAESREIVLTQLSQAARQALVRIYRDLNGVVAARIEADVFDVKNKQ